jgi:hypothetical protein
MPRFPLVLAGWHKHTEASKVVHTHLFWYQIWVGNAVARISRTSPLPAPGPNYSGTRRQFIIPHPVCPCTRPFHSPTLPQQPIPTCCPPSTQATSSHTLPSKNGRTQIRRLIPTWWLMSQASFMRTTRHKFHSERGLCSAEPIIWTTTERPVTCSCTTTTFTPNYHYTGTISSSAFRCRESCLGELLKECAITTHTFDASRMPHINLASLLTKSAQRLYACLLMELSMIS